MGAVPHWLATELHGLLRFERGVETGTYQGRSTRAMARVLPTVYSIELSPIYHQIAARNLRDVPNVQLLDGDSRELLRGLPPAAGPTLYYLDGHWSGEDTAGQSNQCPLMDELRAIGVGHADDAIVIDDARFFLAAPPPPHDVSDWPSFMDIYDLLRELRPDHYVTILDDQIVAVPRRAKPIVDSYALVAPSLKGQRRRPPLPAPIKRLLRRIR